MIDIKNFDINLLTIVKSGRYIKIMYDNKPLEFVTATLYSPFGVKSNKKDWSMFEDYYIDCSIHNEKTINSAIEFSDFLQKLQEHIKILCKENWSTVDSKGVTNYENVTFTPILKENKTYPKLVKLNFSRDKNGNFTSFIFDENKEKISINENNIDEVLTRGKRFKCIIECTKLWLFNDKIGTIWNINQLKLSSKTEVSDNIDVISDELPSENKTVDYSKIIILDDD